jgi:hypothetical protein
MKKLTLTSVAPYSSPSTATENVEERQLVLEDATDEQTQALQEVAAVEGSAVVIVDRNSLLDLRQVAGVTEGEGGDGSVTAAVVRPEQILDLTSVAP